MEKTTLLAFLALGIVCSALIASGQLVGELTVGKGGTGKEAKTNMVGRFCAGYGGVVDDAGVLPGVYHLGCYPVQGFGAGCAYLAEVVTQTHDGDVEHTFDVIMDELSAGVACPAQTHWTLEITATTEDCETAVLANDDGTGYTGGEITLDRNEMDQDTAIDLDVSLKEAFGMCIVNVTATSVESAGVEVTGQFILANGIISLYCPTCNIPDIPYELYKVLEPDTDEEVQAVLDDMERVLKVLWDQCIKPTTPYPSGPSTITLPPKPPRGSFTTTGSQYIIDPYSPPVVFLESALYMGDAADHFKLKSPEHAARFATQAKTLAQQGLYNLCLPLGLTDECMRGAR